MGLTDICECKPFTTDDVTNKDLVTSMLIWEEAFTKI